MKLPLDAFEKGTVLEIDFPFEDKDEKSIDPVL